MTNSNTFNKQDSPSPGDAANPSLGPAMHAEDGFIRVVPPPADGGNGNGNNGHYAVEVTVAQPTGVSSVEHGSSEPNLDNPSSGAGEDAGTVLLRVSTQCGPGDLVHTASAKHPFVTGFRRRWDVVVAGVTPGTTPELRWDFWMQTAGSTSVWP